LYIQVLKFEWYVISDIDALIILNVNAKPDIVHKVVDALTGRKLDIVAKLYVQCLALQQQENHEEHQYLRQCKQLKKLKLSQ
jgi:hypothetical protein